MDKAYWVEARRGGRRNQVNAYVVRTKTAQGDVTLHTFPIRPGEWEVSLYLANMTRDDLNHGVE